MASATTRRKADESGVWSWWKVIFSPFLRFDHSFLNNTSAARDRRTSNRNDSRNQQKTQTVGKRTQSCRETSTKFVYFSFQFHQISKLLPTFHSAHDPTSTTPRHPQCHPPTAIHPQDHQIIPLRITKTEQIGHIPPPSFSLSQTPRLSRDIHPLVHGDFQ